MGDLKDVKKNIREYCKALENHYIKEAEILDSISEAKNDAELTKLALALKEARSEKQKDMANLSKTLLRV